MTSYINTTNIDSDHIRSKSLSIDGEWVALKTVDKAKKFDNVIQILAESYPEVLADLVLQGVIK